jgi:hypothetical protein
MSDDQSRSTEEQRAHHIMHDNAGMDQAEGHTPGGATAAYSPTILNDARMSGRGNAPVRAAAIQQMQQTHGNRAVQRLIQRAARTSSLPEPQEDIGARIQARSGGGSTLDAGVQRQLETGLGADMSGVRVHTDHEADHMARSVDSVAFTSGSDIYFRSGAYNPTTTEGMHLLAHEATHADQQARGPVAGTPTAGGVAVSDPSDSFEQAAEASAARVTAGITAQRTAASAGTAGLAVQRAAPDEEEPVQTMRTSTYASVQREAAPDEEELPAQTMRASTYASVQRAAPDEEEPMQTMRTSSYASVQRASPEEEEPVQAMRTSTYASVQRAAPEEEEPVQAMRSSTYASIQREAAEEEQ